MSGSCRRALRTLFKGRGLTKCPTSPHKQTHDLTNISPSIFRDIDSGHGNNNCFNCRYIDQIGDNRPTPTAIASI